MGEIGYFLVGLGVCAAAAGAAVALVHRKLGFALNEICGSEKRYMFLSVAAEAWIFLRTVSSALYWNPDLRSERGLFLASLRQVECGLSKLGWSLMMVSAAVMFFVFIEKMGRGHGKETRTAG